MLGKLLHKIRKDKKFSQAGLAREANIDVGYINHIEKGDRYPSHQILKRICNAYDVPYQQLMYSYDKTLTEEQIHYGFINHVAYNSIIAIKSLEDIIYCPAKFGTATFSLLISDDTMEPTLNRGLYAFVECNTPLDHKDLGLFYYQDKFIIRRFFVTKTGIVLRTDNHIYRDIKISKLDDFYIIGKILGTNDDY